MKTKEELANEWVEQYAFQVPYNSKGPIANEEFYNKERLQYGRDGFNAGYDSASQQLSALQQENKDLSGKVEFYRSEMEKLRDYCETNKIGKPNQKLLDAIYEHLEWSDLEIDKLRSNQR